MAPNQQQQHSSDVDLVTQGYLWKSKAYKENVKGLIKITSWINASFVVIKTSGEEDSALRMVKQVRLVENLITLL